MNIKNQYLMHHDDLIEYSNSSAEIVNMNNRLSCKKIELFLSFVKSIENENFQKIEEALFLCSQLDDTRYIGSFSGNNSKNNKIVYLITGPIGGGKSLVTKNFIRFFELSNLQFISADIYCQKMFGDLDESFEVRYQLGKQYSETQKKIAVAHNRTFIHETVIAKEEKFIFLESCKQSKYKIVGVYVGVASPSICVERAQKRLQEGGFYVSPEKIFIRYYQCMDNLFRFASISDELYVIDNTGIKPNLIMCQFGAKKYFIQNPSDWFTHYYLGKNTFHE